MGEGSPRGPLTVICDHVGVPVEGRDAVVFVYGTLMPGEQRWPVLGPYAASWAPATAPGRLWDTGDGYPAARFDDGAGEVRGVAVVLVAGTAADALRALDEVEAEGSLYGRVAVRTSRGDALSYEWLGPTEGLVPLAGGWRRRR